MADVFFEAALDEHASNPSTVIVMVDHRTHDPRKRFHWVHQFAEVAKRLGLRVVVVGRADRTLLPDGVEYIESPSDEKLAELYSGALATFYPSSYEGQGLPPLEAMAAGCPVIAFANSSVTEMVAVEEFLLLDPLPWVSQRFDEPMPRTTISEIEAKLRSWARSAETVRAVRVLARERAESFRRAQFVEALGRIYGEDDGVPTDQ
ncbi:hypothetical protein C1N91_02450 [Curtobacterium sp. SGAir0471]|uniref:glycosyltransferase n=1 Tax=Curtobacterium sp. SGAir0471 TaxID=2070337 RepID=UPI0010CD4591|nr:glycosyltransferase [Curtobacterium sp. SGAir0471]QCR42574.1 hypothetical protein C1N91_02450 [Curtobacterium sp. SGAir0471]